MTRRLFCFGLGYCARALARSLASQGWEVAGSSREGADGAIPFGRAHPLPAGALAGASHILVSIPPDAEGEVVLDAARDEILAAASELRWIGYLSTAGVYGDAGGGWVDEDSQLNPTSERTRRRVAAETNWRELAAGHGLPLHIFRLAGIYGPGRSVLDELRAGTARRIVRPGHRFGRIHLGDILRCLAASMAQPSPGEVFNLTDDEPAEPAAVIEYAAELLGMPPPEAVPFAEAKLSPAALTFWQGSRLVRNDKIKRRFGPLLFPTYREGLRAILDAEGDRHGRA